MKEIFFTRRYRPNRLFHARASVDGTYSNVRRDLRLSTKFFSSGGTARTDVSLAPLASELARNGNFTRGRQSTGRTRTRVEICDFRKKKFFFFTRRYRPNRLFHARASVATVRSRTYVEICDFRNFSPGGTAGRNQHAARSDSIGHVPLASVYRRLAPYAPVLSTARRRPPWRSVGYYKR
jgi:hypothetical protein